MKHGQERTKIQETGQAGMHQAEELNCNTTRDWVKARKLKTLSKTGPGRWERQGWTMLDNLVTTAIGALPGVIVLGIRCEETEGKSQKLRQQMEGEEEP